MTRIRQTVDTSISDRKYLDQFGHNVDALASLVIEMMRDNPVTILSPIFREMLTDKALEVQKQIRKIHNSLALDNPCNTLMLVVT